MSSKTSLPTLQGQRIKTRKRDEREKADPIGFRDSIFAGLHDVSARQNGVTLTGTQPSITPSGSSSTLEQDFANSLKIDSGSEIITNGSAGGGSKGSSSNEPTPNGTPVHGRRNGAGSPVPSLPPGADIPPLDVELICKFLDSAASKLDFRRYGEVLFDILVAGGNLAPGGSIITESETGKPYRTEVCLLRYGAEKNPDSEPLTEEQQDIVDLVIAKSFAQIIVRLTRRYKYLERNLEDEFKKIIIFLKAFTPEERRKISKLTGILINVGTIPPTVLLTSINDTLVKDGIAVEFLITVLDTWIQEKNDPAAIWNSLRKSGIDTKLMDFLPVNKRSLENLQLAFALDKRPQLGPLLELHKAQEGQSVKKELHTQVVALVGEGAAVKEITAQVKDALSKNSLPEHEVSVLLWNAIMAAVEWNKKPDLIPDNSIKHLKTYAKLMANFTTTPKAELALMIRIQDYCFDNMNFLKLFKKIVMLFYKADVLSEDTIIHWYKSGASPKGKTHFLDQMKDFIDWLQNAEEESDEE